MAGEIQTRTIVSLDIQYPQEIHGIGIHTTNYLIVIKIQQPNISKQQQRNSPYTTELPKPFPLSDAEYGTIPL
jgi:hypothetical protein